MNMNTAALITESFLWDGLSLIHRGTDRTITIFDARIGGEQLILYDDVQYDCGVANCSHSGFIGAYFTYTILTEILEKRYSCGQKLTIRETLLVGSASGMVIVRSQACE